MKARIDIDMDNAAFADAPAEELRRILWGLCGALAKDGNALLSVGKLKLSDINGNKVGKFTITGAREE